MTLETQLKHNPPQQAVAADVKPQLYRRFLDLPRRAPAAFARQLDLWLALALLVAISNFSYVLSSPTVVWGLSFLDHSWAFDFIVKAQENVWLGDRVTFSYGPLVQLASSAIAIPLGGSLGAYLRSSHLLLFWSGIVLTFLTGRLLLGGHSSWKRSFYLLALVGFWNALDLRFCYDLFTFAAALAGFDRVRQLKSGSWWASFAVALLVVAGFLISADTGVYSLAALIIAGSAHLLVYRSDRLTFLALLRAAAMVGLLFAGLVLLTAVLMRDAGFGFWTNSLEVVNQYRWSMAAAMDKPVKWRLMAASATSLLVLLIAYRWRDSLASSLARRPAFFPAAAAFSFLTLQSAIVRPAWGHVAIALLPSLGLAGAVLMGAERRAHWNWRGDLPLLLALALTTVFSGPTPSLVPKNLVAGLRLNSVTNSQTCPHGTFYIDEACLPRIQYEPLRAASEYLQKNTSPGETVAIFPFENMYAGIARRQVAGGMLQNYQIAGERLLHRQLHGLERDNPRLAIFSADGLATFMVDGVPNFTRTPEVWFHLQSRFKRVSELVPGVIALERDRTRASRWHMEKVPLLGPTHSRVLHKQPINLAWSNWPTVADFLKITLKVDYPLWWKVRKPSALTITIVHSDGSQKILRAVVPPNESSVLWIYPWDDIHLPDYFAAEESAWRGGRSRAAPCSLQLTFQRMDDVSVVPSNLSVESVEAVLLRLR